MTTEARLCECGLESLHKGAHLTHETLTMRRLLWSLHASENEGHGRYGDDGELQCNGRDGYCDFKRGTVEEIVTHIVARGHRLLAKATSSRTIREALESARAGVWDAYYGKGIAVEYARSVDAKVDEALRCLESPR